MIAMDRLFPRAMQNMSDRNGRNLYLCISLRSFRPRHRWKTLIFIYVRSSAQDPQKVLPGERVAASSMNSCPMFSAEVAVASVEFTAQTGPVRQNERGAHLVEG